MNEGPRPEPQSAVTFRHIFRGKVTWALPCRTVSQSDEVLATYLGPGVVVQRPKFGERKDYFHLLAKGSWEYEAFIWYNHHLQMVEFGDAHAVTAIWDEQWQFMCWYINLQEPLRPSPYGFDTFDQVLDIVVYPNDRMPVGVRKGWTHVGPDDELVWRWKDEEEFALGLELKMFSQQDAERIRAEGERVISQLASHPLLSEQWLTWRPPPNWRPATLPEGWSQV
ncbi:MAG: DUF402 domain-containing protein [Actinobacteria bacterium]|nr:DUF402 domain-containing protein [Actinomycetota bacterium]